MRPESTGVKLSGSQIVCESLLRAGVDVLFGIPGGAAIPFYDALLEYPFRHVLVRHEQAAAHAADGYGRATGRPGVCVATSGPGATNLVTGIATAYLDSSPMVIITAQVPTSYIGKDAFQEIDITGITLPITKHNYLVESVHEVGRVMKEAFHIASTGRPGPVLVDLPKNVLTDHATWDPAEPIKLLGYRPTLFGHRAQIRRAAQLINGARKPVIVAGQGVIISGAAEQLLKLAEAAHIPVATTLLGIGAFPETHDLSIGMMGMHGELSANRAISEADVLLALGMRYDDRATGKVSAFAPNAQIIHVDVDPAEIGKNVRVNIPIVGDVKNVLSVLSKEILPADRSSWVAKVETWKLMPKNGQILNGTPTPEQIMAAIREKTRGKALIVTDVGQNQMWAAKNYTYTRPNSFISSGGLGTMGFGLPAAMGAKIGCPEEDVWVISGDGGFQMNLQELSTIKQEQVELKIIILNNGYLGMVRQWQELFYRARYSQTKITGPDYVKLADAYGIPGYRVEKAEDVDSTLEKVASTPGTVIAEFIIPPEANVFPMIPPGATIEDSLFEEDDE